VHIFVQIANFALLTITYRELVTITEQKSYRDCFYAI